MEVCRLCLDLLHRDENFVILNDDLKTAIHGLDSELDLDISLNPVICTTCLSSVNELREFKTKCSENQELIKSRLNGDSDDQLTLKEILYGVTLGEIILTEKIKGRICRTCLDSIDGESFTVLLPTKPDPYLNSMLTMCLSELDLTLCQEPVMCEKCLSTLQKLHHLKTTCLDVEEKLKTYCTTYGTNSSAQINLHNVLEALLTDDFVSVHNNIKTEILEPNDDQIPDALPADKDLMANVKELLIEEPVLGDVKVEQMELKTEEAASTLELLEDKKDEKKFKKLNKLELIMKEIMQNHKKEIHYSCSQCAFTMSNRRHYVMHMLTTHTTFNDETRLMHFCNLCSYKTMFKHQMKKHIENFHMEKEKLSCPYCSFTSLYSTNLKRHISIHEDMQDLACSHPQCDFKTSYKFSLQRHEIKMHGNQCSVCSYKNRNRSAIQRHLRTVHGIYEIHQCDKCNFKTFYLMTLKRHNAREHKGMMKNNFTSVKKNKDELTAEEEEEIKNLFES